MKDLIFNEHGGLNKTKVDFFIQNKGIDTLINVPGNAFSNHTLLSAVMYDEDLDSEQRLSAVEYLLRNNASIDEELLALALFQNNVNLASELFEYDAPLNSYYEDNNIAEIALNSEEQEVMIWVLEHAKPLFLKMDKNTFLNVYIRIREIFLVNEKEADLELVEFLAKIYRKYLEQEKKAIVSRFDCLGSINKYDTEMVLAAKLCDKPYKASIFVINNKDLPNLTTQVKKLIEENTIHNKLKFQIIYTAMHAIFGEFEIDKTQTPPVIRYLHCDPYPGLIEYDQIITKDFLLEISPLANIEIYDSRATIQKTLGCFYFSLDGAMMLATPADRDYVENVIVHMQRNAIKSYTHDNVKYTSSLSLPVRFLRGLQYYDETLKKVTGPTLFSIFNSPNAKVIVNKSKHTAEININKDLKETEKKSKIKSGEKEFYVHNIRMERKMEQYQTAVQKFIANKDIFSPEFSEILNQFTIKGLERFAAANTLVINLNWGLESNGVG